MKVRISNIDKNFRYNSAQSLAKVMQQVLMRENELRRVQEHFWIIGLNPKMNIVLIELIALGTHNRVIIPPVDVFRLVVTKNATNAVLVHNHPGGTLKPSEDDKSITNRLLKAGGMLGIKVLDHLIVTEDMYFSFADGGIMDELRAYDEWKLVSKESAEINKFQREMDSLNAALENSLMIARKLRIKGMSDLEIKQVTGLSVRELKML